jgi:hypothetical protein
MKFITKSAVAAALATLALSASAMTAIQDTELSAVSGQDGVSIAADLHVNIGSFVYKDTDTTGGSVSFNNIAISGIIAASIDIINAPTFGAKMVGLGVDTTAAVATGFYNGTSDVVQIAIPEVAAGKYLTMSVDSIKMGNSTASFGSMALNSVDMRGTKVWIWAH